MSVLEPRLTRGGRCSQMASWPASGLSTSSSAPGRGACSWGFLFGLGLPAVQPGQTTRELHHAERGESDGRGQDADSSGRSWRGGGEGNGVGDLAAGRPGAGRVVSAEHGMDGELHSCALGSRTVALTSVTPVHSVEVKKLQTEESGVSNATLPLWKDRAERTRVFGGVHRRPGHPPVFTQHTLHGRTG